MKRIGITDTPCNNIGDDSLGVEKYIKGLENFVKSCPTPMSIALQGDWGTGKTSFINSIVGKLKQKVQDVSKAEEITKTVLNITKSIFTQVLKSNVDIDFEKVKNDVFQKEIEKMQAVEDLKCKFE